VSQDTRRAAWQYMGIVVVHERRRITKADPEAARVTAEQRARWEQSGSDIYLWREDKAYLWFPGASTPREELIGDEGGGPSHSLLEILNDLGYEGWEVVSVRDHHTAMTNDEYLGWTPPVAFPVSTTYLLKRPLGAVQPG
jgi:hypothetical protein